MTQCLRGVRGSIVAAGNILDTFVPRQYIILLPTKLIKVDLILTNLQLKDFNLR